MEVRRKMADAVGGYTCDHMKEFEVEVSDGYSHCSNLEIPDCGGDSEARDCDQKQEELEDRRNLAEVFGGYKCHHMAEFQEEVNDGYSHCSNLKIPDCNGAAMNGFNLFQLLIILLAFLFRH